MTYLKITNLEENHYGLQYHDGLVEDIVPFDPENLVSIGADIHDCDDCSLRYALTYGHQKVVDYIKSLG